jgi:hypothetical protein
MVHLGSFGMIDEKKGNAMNEKLMKYFNKQPRLGTLSTASKEGKVNVAYFGSPLMTDPKMVFMGLGNNLTLANLKENPWAAYMIMEPGNTLPEWKGVRLYLKVTEIETEGNKLEQIRRHIAEKAGPNAAKGIQAAVTFEVIEVRPLADFGQGWEKSI